MTRTALVLCGLSTMSAWGQSAESALYNDAVARVRAGDWTTACEMAARIVRTQPDFYAPYNLLGLCAARNGDRPQAEASFRKSIELNPGFADSRNNLGIELLRSGDRERAMEQFAATLLIDPENLTALHNLGRLELETEKIEGALPHLQSALMLAPADLSIRLALAEALALSGDEPRAQDLLRESLRDRPSLGAELLSLARSASAQGRYGSARAILAGFAPSPSQAGEWHALTGYAHFKLGHPKEAQQLLRRAVELEPKVEANWLNLTELLLFHQSFEAAVAILESGLGSLPESARLHLGIGVALIAAGGRDEEGLKHLETALQIQPDLELAFSALCEARHRRKEWNQLDRVAGRWLRRNPKAHEPFFYQALALLDSGPPDQDQTRAEVERLLSKSIELQPSFAPARIALGKLMNLLGEPEQALREFLAASEADPEEPAAQYQIAMTYRRLGQLELSRNALETFKQIKAGRQSPRIVFRLFTDER